MTIEADAVILAIGNFPAAPLPGDETLTPQQYIAVPWDKNIASGLDSEASVLFVGTGLTMVDGAITLQHHRHRGKSWPSRDEDFYHLHARWPSLYR